MSSERWGFIGQKDLSQTTKGIWLSSFDFRLSTDNEQWEVSSRLKARSPKLKKHYITTLHFLGKDKLQYNCIRPYNFIRRLLQKEIVKGLKVGFAVLQFGV